MSRGLLPAVLLALLAGPLPSCGGGGGGGGGFGRNARVVVKSVKPADGAESIPASTKVTLEFRVPMDEASLAGGALVLAPQGSVVPVPSALTVTGGGTTATIAPGAPLEGGTVYQVRLSGGALRADGRPIREPWFSSFRIQEGGTPPPPPPPPSQTGSVWPVGAMGTGRSGHASVTLADGRAAVFGGFRTDTAVTATVELFDPDDETWTTSAASLTLARARLSATLLPDGTVLLAGGETDSTSDIGVDRWEIFDPALDAITHSGSLAERRTRHRAVLLGSGKVLLAGGSRTDTSGGPNFSRTSTEIFDPSTRVSSTGPNMAVPRAGHRATTLSDGRVMVTGGHGSDARAEIYDPGAGTWSVAAAMTVARRDHTATLLADGSVLVAGGGTFTAERWLPSPGQWYQVQNMGDTRSLHTAVRIANGRVFLAGGEKPGTGGSTFFHAGTEFYNPPTASFIFPPLNLRAPRSGHGAVVLPGGDVLVTGGKNTTPGAEALRSCDRVHLD